MNSPTFRLYVADDIKTDDTGKLMLFGLYPDGVVIYEAARDPTPDAPNAFRSLGFVINVANLPERKQHVVSVAHVGSRPEVAMAHVFKDRIIPHPGKGRSFNVHFTQVPFAFASAGKRAIRVEIDGQSTDLFYELRRVASVPALPIRLTIEDLPSKSSSVRPKRAAKKKVATPRKETAKRGV